MKNSNIRIVLGQEKKELALLKEERDNLDVIIKELTEINEEYSRSNLSGKTFEESLNVNEFFLKKLNARYNKMNYLIHILEVACNKYTAVYDKTTSSIGG